jgi:hypothetical protein
MLKWFEWQSQHHDADLDGRFDATAYISQNVESATGILKTWLDQGDWTYSTRPCIDPDLYVPWCARDYAEYGVTSEQLMEWINDPRYEKLMKQSGVGHKIPIKPEVREQFVSALQEAFDLDWSSATMDLTVQFPGEMFPLHRDKIKFKDFGLREEQENLVSRYLIMLDDQQPGQCFFMENQSVVWQAGDVINWNHYQFQHHGSANFGYWPRFTVRLTGRRQNG